jgi:hypothetical protein
VRYLVSFNDALNCSDRIPSDLEIVSAYTILVRKLEGKRPHRWKDNIKINIKETRGGGGGVDWINLIMKKDQWRTLATLVLNIRVP